MLYEAKDTSDNSYLPMSKQPCLIFDHKSDLDKNNSIFWKYVQNIGNAGECI